MSFVWLLSLPTRNASLADIFWGLGFVLIAWLSFGLTGGYLGRKLLLWVSLFTVFLTQAILLWVISLVVQLGQLSPVPSRLTILDVLGTLVWGVGFVVETVADWQLVRFKADPNNKGRVMNRGLWAYSRHPNYFGETLIWWGFFLITLTTPYGYWAIVSPLTITFLLLKVSGVTLLEKDITERRPEYREYIKNTSPFIPWFPKRKES
ncbi:MAG: DUF1295 domain-containing protein [Syntrophobacterales bacterium]